MRLFNKKAGAQAKGGSAKNNAGTEWVSCYENISKLIECGYLEVKLNDDKPSAFLSLQCYRAFCCDKGGIFVDDTKASAFLDKVRFFINFRRSYASGLTDSMIDLGDKDEDKWKYPPIKPDEWINIYVASSDGKSILLYGRWNDKSLELRKFENSESRNIGNSD